MTLTAYSISLPGLNPDFVFAGAVFGMYPLVFESLWGLLSGSGFVLTQELRKEP